MKNWIFGIGVFLIAVPLVIFLILASSPFLYCYGGGVEHFTTTLANGSTTTYTLVAMPACGTPPSFSIWLLGVPLVGLFLVALGVRKK